VSYTYISQIYYFTREQKLLDEMQRMRTALEEKLTNKQEAAQYAVMSFCNVTRLHVVLERRLKRRSEQ